MGRGTRYILSRPRPKCFTLKPSSGAGRRVGRESGLVGLRIVGKSRVMALVAVLLLTHDVAAASWMFSVVNSFMLEPLPYEAQDEFGPLADLRGRRGLRHALVERACISPH